jgi:uncharacterized protein (TIGR02186 family)
MFSGSGRDRRIHGVAVILLVFTVLYGLNSRASATEGALEVGASETNIFIEPDFAGTTVVIFGALDGTKYRLIDSSSDLAVLVRGPSRPVTVWQKRRVAGVWVNDKGITFENVPSFYLVLSTRPLRDIAPVDERIGQELGLDALSLQPIPADKKTHTAQEIEKYRAALIRQKKRRGVYEERISGIEFLGDRLFRARAALPASAAPGQYRASVFLLDEKQIISRSSSFITLQKAGLERFLSTAADDYPLFYGVAAVLLATFTGGVASLLLRR